jgi:hypothetical protein
VIVVDELAAHLGEQALFDFHMQGVFIGKVRVSFDGAGQHFAFVFVERWLMIGRFYRPFLCLCAFLVPDLSFPVHEGILTAEVAVFPLLFFHGVILDYSL